jgi:tRNA(Ser,Leu) C12 N-acetylase TAN1
VLGLRVPDPASFLDDFAAAVAASPGILNFVSHVAPAQETFDFSTTEEFETRARAIALARVPQLRGKSFHVRLHRRGFKGVLSSHHEEQFLADALLAVLQSAGHVAFTDPDAIIQIETIDGRAGMSLRTRDDIRRFPFLGAE